MASDESLPREIISLCVAATYVWTHYCQITHIGLIGLNAHKQKHTQKTTTCEGLWATRLTFLDQNSSICCNCATETQNSDSAEAAGNAFTCSLKSPNCTADDLQGQKLFLTAASCVSSPIDFLFSESHGSTLANGAELCNSMQLYAHFFLSS